jgi:subtilisin family serine protease
MINSLLYADRRWDDLMPGDKSKIISNEYMDLIIKHNGNTNILKQYEALSVQVMNPSYAVIYLPVSKVSTRLITDYGYSAIPKCYALMSDQSLEASGITKLRSIPALNLRGRGVIIGIIDTGIDYTNPVFQNKDGTTKILAIWDQSLDSEDQYPKVSFSAYFGTEFTSEQINQALKSSDPLQVVPSVDSNGHGTMLAGIAAGSENKENNFSGVVPDAGLLIVKLKQAKKNLTDFFSIPSDVICYQENDIIWAIQYLVDTARKFKRPLAICIGLGTLQGSHGKSGCLNTVASIAGDFPGVAVTVAAGNEGNSRRHFYSALEPSGTALVEMNVGANETGFSMELWGTPPMIYTLDILSPTGEHIPTLSERLVETRTIRFIFEQTIINVDYIMIEQETGKQVIILRFINPTQGTWKFNVTGKGDLKGDFHVWLPAGNFISGDTYFLESNAYTTITSPGNTIVPITVTAYNSNSDALYPQSGKGFSTSDIINPDIAAPGVNIQCPALNHGFTTLTGTSAAAAHTAGITAMVLEWGIVENNYPDLDTVGIKKFLIRGARRSSQLQYPNRDWGYGIIDVYDAYNFFRTDVI